VPSGLEKYVGTVSQVMGAGIMALFGARRLVEDHAGARLPRPRSACRTSSATTATTSSARTAVPIQIRVGLHSGEVALNVTGHGLHMSYTPSGQAVHLAARMEQMAKPGSVLATVETAAAREGYVERHPDRSRSACQGLRAPDRGGQIRRTAARVSRFDHRAPSRRDDAVHGPRTASRR